MANEASTRRSRRSTLINAGIFAWSCAEATVFFIVPDVLLTFAVATYPRPTLNRLAAWVLLALTGALVGGTAMYVWGTQNEETARKTILAVPGIDESMSASVRNALHEDGLWPMIVDGVTGVPYKIWAVESGATGVGYVPFLCASALARGVRFALSTLVVLAICATLARTWSARLRGAVTIGCWILIYAIYVVVLMS